MDKSDNEDLVQQVSTEKEGIPEQASSGGVNESRRALTKMGLATPALVTLASRPVFGAQCLSQMMSGNMSQPGTGSCDLGWSPGAWKNPCGQINNMDTLDAWKAAGFYYGKLRSKRKGKPCQCGSYSGGTKLKDTALGVARAVTSDITMQKILCHKDYQGSELWHCIAAYLNASLSANSGGTFNYILTVQQVIYFCTHPYDVPQPYTSLNDFLDSTWPQ